MAELAKQKDRKDKKKDFKNINKNLLGNKKNKFWPLVSMSLRLY